MTVVHTYFYIVVDTQRGCHTLKIISFLPTHFTCQNYLNCKGKINSWLGIKKKNILSST